MCILRVFPKTTICTVRAFLLVNCKYDGSDLFFAFMIHLSGYLSANFTFDSMNHVHMILASVKAAFSIISPNILIMMMVITEIANKLFASRLQCLFVNQVTPKEASLSVITVV